MRRFRALSLAFVLSALAAPAAPAQEIGTSAPALWGLGLPDVPAWWTMPGRPGYAPDVDRGTSFPWSRAGLAMGAWALDAEPHLPFTQPTPGIVGSTTALIWNDTLAIEPLASSGGSPWDATLARAAGRRALRPGGRTHAIVGARFDGFDAREPYVTLGRGDSTRHAALSLLSGNREPAGPYGRSGRHMWSLETGLGFGAQHVSGGYTQRGQAMALVSGEEQSASGQAGRLDWQWSKHAWQARLGVARAWDQHQSADTVFSRRDADENRAMGSVLWRRGGREVEWHGGASRARVRRDVAPSFDSEADAWWTGLRGARTVGDGVLEASLDVAQHSALDRVVALPSLRYRVTSDAFDGGLAIARIATPVWSDLGVGESAFLQDTWVAGLDAATRIGTRGFLRVAAELGRTQDRAVLFRLPLEDLWLRNGAVADPELWTFGLYTLSARWEGATSAVRGEGFALARDAHAIQPKVDPGSGFRIEGEWRFSAFQNDLGVTLRADAAGVASRESEASTPRTLDGYVTSGASVIMALGDAVVVVRALNLENTLHEEPWIDLATGREALGPGREVRFILTVKLWD